MGLLSRIIDLTIKPTREASVASILPASDLRVYDSSIEGHVTFVLYSSHPGRWIEAATRLNADQVTEVRDALNEWLRVSA